MNVWGGKGPIPLTFPPSLPPEGAAPSPAVLLPQARAHVDVHGLGGGAVGGQALPCALLPRRTVVLEDSPTGRVGPRGIHSPVSIDDGPAPRASECWRGRSGRRR